MLKGKLEVAHRNRRSLFGTGFQKPHHIGHDGMLPVCKESTGRSFRLLQCRTPRRMVLHGLIPKIGTVGMELHQQVTQGIMQPM